METEREKMTRGGPYDSGCTSLAEARAHVRELVARFNASAPDAKEERAALLREILPNSSPQIFLEPPFHCEYGFNLHIGPGSYFNFNAILMDCGPITIGARTLVGPDANFLGAVHPTDAAERNTLVEYTKPIVIGEDCWIGGRVTILPGVTIGDRVVVGAGSVVTKDVGSDVVVAGNPARVIKDLSSYYHGAEGK